jgi:hypothetical protein
MGREPAGVGQPPVSVASGPSRLATFYGMKKSGISNPNSPNSGSSSIGSSSIGSSSKPLFAGFSIGPSNSIPVNVHLLKSHQTKNIRLLLESVEDELSRGRDQAELTETAHAWLLALRQRIAEVEEDTQDAFRVRRQLTRLLVARITVGKTHEGGTEVRITYRFGPPPGEDCSEVGGEEDYSVVGSFKNGSIS